jgi:hypothetical protein
MKKIVVLIVVLSALILSVSVFAQDEAPTTNFGTYNLSAGFLPDPFIISTDLTISGESVDAALLDIGQRCVGFITEIPDVIFNWSGDSQGIRIFFVGDADATLIV